MGGVGFGNRFLAYRDRTEELRRSKFLFNFSALNVLSGWWSGARRRARGRAVPRSGMDLWLGLTLAEHQGVNDEPYVPWSVHSPRRRHEREVAVKSGPRKGAKFLRTDGPLAAGALSTMLPGHG